MVNLTTIAIVVAAWFVLSRLVDVPGPVDTAQIVVPGGG